MPLKVNVQQLQSSKSATYVYCNNVPCTFNDWTGPRASKRKICCILPIAHEYCLHCRQPTHLCFLPALIKGRSLLSISSEPNDPPLEDTLLGLADSVEPLQDGPAISQRCIYLDHMA